jgi:NADPH-dependent 2,4-dienoyl-CoA reductase/sulfur reductase-like enzyme
MPPRIVIIGGGFAGLACARGLAKAAVQVTLIDRRNFHLFQPLLYQVASGSLSPGDISAPLRSVLRHQKNTQVLLGEVVDFDVAGRRVILADGEDSYDTLVLAAGARTTGRPTRLRSRPSRTRPKSAAGSLRPLSMPSASRTRACGGRGFVSLSWARDRRGSNWPGRSAKSPATR